MIDRTFVFNMSAIPLHGEVCVTLLCYDCVLGMNICDVLFILGQLSFHTGMHITCGFPVLVAFTCMKWEVCV